MRKLQINRYDAGFMVFIACDVAATTIFGAYIAHVLDTPSLLVGVSALLMAKVKVWVDIFIEKRM